MHFLYEKNHFMNVRYEMKYTIYLGVFSSCLFCLLEILFFYQTNFLHLIFQKNSPLALYCSINVPFSWVNRCINHTGVYNKQTTKRKNIHLLHHIVMTKQQQYMPRSTTTNVVLL